MSSNPSNPPPLAPLRAWRPFVCLALGLGLTMAAPGHDLFTAYIQHRIALTLGAEYLDVTVQLTFFEDGSQHEREHMDTNGDGQLSRREIDRYLAGLETSSARAVTLRLAGKPVELTPLYAPQLDLLGNDRVGRGHHRLTLHFFATTPNDLAVNWDLTSEDRLGPGIRSLGALQVEGRVGARLEALPAADPLHPPARDGAPREFRARLLAPPVLPIATPGAPANPQP